jgi:hypothetical protein
MKDLLKLLEKTFDCVYRLTDEITRNNVFKLGEIQDELAKYIVEINKFAESADLQEESLLRQAIEILQNKIVLKHAYTLKSGLVYYESDQKMEFDEEEFEVLNKFLKYEEN